MSFAVLLQELEIRPVSAHPPQLDLIVAVYVALSDTLSSKCEFSVFMHFPLFTQLISYIGLTMMDAHLGRTCKKLALEGYVHLLSLVAESLADSKHVLPNRLSHIVRLATLLLHEHPSRQFQDSIIDVEMSFLPS